VVRGGSWGNAPELLRAARRDGFTKRSDGVGFRVARTLSP
jgi:formylglycine-generating enzyme required for sulfatase activity